MNAQQQAALAQSQAAKAQQQAAKTVAPQAEPTNEQKAQLKAYYEQQQMQQQIFQAGINSAITTYNLDVGRLGACAQTLESAWKILNVEGNEDEVNGIVATTRTIYSMVNDIVTELAEKAALRKEEMLKAIEAAKAIDLEAQRLAAEQAAIEQPQNMPVVSPSTGEAPVAG